ncbi:hypothetical protein KXW20_002299, partial [Aspergillus fumigatus]
RESNAFVQNPWWSRLSPNKAKRLRQLTFQDNAYLWAAFDQSCEPDKLPPMMSVQRPKANPTRAKARAKADESIAKATLLKARKPDHYRYDSETFEPLIEQIAGCFALAIPNEAPQAAPITGRAIKLNER